MAMMSRFRLESEARVPIRGMTDREEGAFPQIGVIRKGAPKTQNAPGKELPYFRVEIDEKEAQAKKDFVDRFGNTPTDIIIMLPFNEIDRCWEAWRETYVAGALIHRCDGENVQYAIDSRTGEKLVLGGLGANGRPVLCRGKADGCKPVGRLRVIVPELKRLAYLIVMTTSVHDIINISEQLKGIASMNGGRIAGIPLMLRRRPKKISTPSGENGKRARREKWLISIEADPEWVKEKLVKMHHDALPGNGFDEAKQIAAPTQLKTSGPNWGEPDEDEEEQEGEIVEQEARELPSDNQLMPTTLAEAYKQGAQDGAANPAIVPQATLSPDSIRAKIAGLVGARQGQEANEKQTGLAIRMLEACFDSNDKDLQVEMRHRVTKFLFGASSSKELGAAHFLAVLDWLKPTRNGDNKYHPSEEGQTEARVIERAELMAEGQMELPEESA